jgi:hypothetical protein
MPASMRRSFLVLAALSMAAPVAGCGGAAELDAPAAAAGATIEARYPPRGIAFRAPAGWSLEAGTAPLVATVRTGQATVAIWRFPRSEPLPRTPAELEAARQAILAEAMRRDSSFDVVKSAATRVAGRPAVQIRARETVAGRRQVVRSTHIYHAGGEVVVDAYAEPDSFRSIDAEVFRPLLRSLSVTRPRGGA